RLRAHAGVAAAWPVGKIDSGRETGGRLVAANVRRGAPGDPNRIAGIDIAGRCLDGNGHVAGGAATQIAAGPKLAGGGGDRALPRGLACLVAPVGAELAGGGAVGQLKRRT